MSANGNGKMRALVFTAPGVVELQDVAQPDARRGETLLNVRAAGICGSELHGFRSIGLRKPPLIMGHEFAGETPEGRRVVVNPLVSCGGCDMCDSGAPQLCRQRELLGVHRPGGFAEHALVPQSALHDIPDEMSWEVAALVEPLANAVHAWKNVDLRREQRVAVIGAGSIGLVMLLVAREQGIEDVHVIDRADARLKVARRLGAKRCDRQLDGEYDVVVDAVGSRSTRFVSVDAQRPGGTAIWLGLAERDSAFDGNDLVRSEKRVVGSFGYTPADFTEALGHAKSMDLDWATPIALEESSEVFIALADGAAEPVKAVIRR